MRNLPDLLTCRHYVAVKEAAKIVNRNYRVVDIEYFGFFLRA